MKLLSGWPDGVMIPAEGDAGLPSPQSMLAVKSVADKLESPSVKVATLSEKVCPSVTLIGKPVTTGGATMTWATAMRAAAASNWGRSGLWVSSALLSAQAG